MQNFTDMLNQSLVNPLKERLNGLKAANQANAEAISKLVQQLAETNERQENIAKELNETSRALGQLVSRVNQLEQDFKASKETQDMLISALEGLQWNEQEEGVSEQFKM